MVAYLLARGRMLPLLLGERKTQRDEVLLGLILGLVGLMEILFPGTHVPYIMHTLIVTFATLFGGLRVGLIAAGTVFLGIEVFPLKQAGIHPAAQGWIDPAVSLTITVLLSAAFRRAFGGRHYWLSGGVAGIGTQTATVLLHRLALPGFYFMPQLAPALFSIPVNGLGVMLLQIFLQDAVTRANSERHRLEAERARVLVTEAQLSALRARVHPHFLFNALTSIAALCGMNPRQAESAILRLSQLMRRVLEADPKVPVCLSEEIEYVRSYLEIEQHRLGDRLQVLWEIDAACAYTQVPPFTLQALVENAIVHGIAPKVGPGKVRIIVRARVERTLVAVADDGAGVADKGRRKARSQSGQGLRIVTEQLVKLYGRSARVRLLSRPGAGTLAAFSVPKGIALSP
ncbi:MAG TPA: histidine kinase [Chthonomonadaceae bacterium]|nr:histidine kinase [Chthonomonadaceae bacterium]